MLIYVRLYWDYRLGRITEGKGNQIDETYPGIPIHIAVFLELGTGFKLGLGLNKLSAILAAKQLCRPVHLSVSLSVGTQQVLGILWG